MKKPIDILTGVLIILIVGYLYYDYNQNKSCDSITSEIAPECHSEKENTENVTFDTLNVLNDTDSTYEESVNEEETEEEETEEEETEEEEEEETEEEEEETEEEE